MELVEIVDKKGNFTGLTIEKEKAHENKLLHNGIIIFIINDKKQILLQKRSENRKFNPNKWESCGGHVHAKEKFEEAAKREIFEELNLKIELNNIFPLSYHEISNDNMHIFHFYYIKYNDNNLNLKIQKDELSEIKWFDLDKVIEMINNDDSSLTFTKNRIPILEKLKNV